MTTPTDVDGSRSAGGHAPLGEPDAAAFDGGDSSATEIASGAEAAARILVHRPFDDVVERLRGTALARLRRRLVEVSGEGLELALDPEGRAPRHRLIEDSAQSVHIDARVDRLAANLFRRDVGERSHPLPGLRKPVPRRRLAGEPEVGEVGLLGSAHRRDEDIRGLDVAVY